MKISFLISAVVFYVVRVVLSNSLQVGTVLFTTTDLVKKCWTENDKSLLKARLIMQDVLPDPDCIDFTKPKSIIILLDYFHSCYEIISISTYGNMQNLMLLALSDTLGGYLRAYILPLTKRAYYAGQIKYSEAKKLFKLYDDIRVFLKTNGIGWAKPQKLCPFKYKLKPLVVSNPNGLDACKQLYTIERKGKICCVTPKFSFHKTSPNKIVKEIDKNEEDSSKFSKREPEPNQDSQKWNHSNPEENDLSSRACREEEEMARNESSKEKTKNFQKLTKISESKDELLRNLFDNLSGSISVDLPKSKDKFKEERKCRCEDEYSKEDDSDCPKKIVIPLPVLDDSTSPHTIAVPFKSRPLRNLYTRTSAFILERYYSTVVKCLVSKCRTSRDIRKFNSQFHSWIVSHVCPHLTNEEWYPAFGGVLRIMETIKKFGAESSRKDPVSHDIAFMFSKGFGFEESENDRPNGKDTRDVGEVVYNFPRYNRYYLFAIFIISAAWLFAFCACVFYVQAVKSKSNYDPHRRSKQARERNSRMLNLQFLIKFFKKNNNDQEICEEVCEEPCDPEPERSHWRKLKHLHKARQENKETPSEEFDKPRERGDFIRKSKKKPDTKHKEKGQLVVTGEGDIPAFIISNAGAPEQPFVPSWPCQTSYIRFEKVGMAMDSHRDGKADDEVRTIWRKPPTRFQRSVAVKELEGGFKKKDKSLVSGLSTTGQQSEDSTKISASGSLTTNLGDRRKNNNTDKRSTCCYSGSCSHTSVTATVSSAKTQAQQKFSSATMEFFEHVIAKHKPSTKSTTQESSDSDSEEDESSSTQSGD